ncbi:hypothetical protein TNCV_4434271 [Trichonephila clavipes]|nr:hypothetical protein TNCV_4434271 [Trichonephila clavipes]
MFPSMEALNKEYYEVVEDEQLPNLELTFEEMEENLEGIKVGLQTLLLKYLLTDISKRIILQSYCDASIAAYGTVVYLRANYQWKHISSRDNPADLISRGFNPSDFEHLELWWSGPSSAMGEIIQIHAKMTWIPLKRNYI